MIIIEIKPILLYGNGIYHKPWFEFDEMWEK